MGDMIHLQDKYERLDNMMQEFSQLKQEMITHLEAEKAHIISEIRHYPPPIPACDAQFNYLLEKRDRISVEIRRLQQVNDVDKLLNFVANSAFIGDVLKKELQD